VIATTETLMVSR